MGVKTSLGRSGRHRYGSAAGQAPPAAQHPKPPPPPPPGPGPRRAALRERRRSRRKALLRAGGAAAVVALVVAVAAAGVVVLTRDRGGRTQAVVDSPSPVGGDSVITTLVIGAEDGGGPARWLELLSYDVRERSGAVVYIPAHTSAEVPGRGSQHLGSAMASGGVDLLRVSTENLLNVPIDRYVVLSPDDTRALFDEIGTLTVDVPSEVHVSSGANEARLLFSEGEQRLSGEFVERLLFTAGMNGDDAELGVRHLALWDALFEAFAGDAGALGRATRASADALSTSDASAEEHASMLSALAALAPPQRDLAVLPVNQVSAGGSELYQVSQEDLAAFLGDTVGASAVREEEQIPIQIVNGNGVPGIGQRVGSMLVDKGFKVVLSGNDPPFDHRRTIIVTYDDTSETLEAARRAREILGVGRLRRSVNEQDIVDLTIVVGKDFLRKR